MGTKLFTAIQIINVAAIVSMLTCILALFTERQLTICVIFRALGFRQKKVKAFFAVVSVILMIRLASYCGDFYQAWTHPVSVLFHVAAAYGFFAVTYQIYRRRYDRRNKQIDHE